MMIYIGEKIQRLQSMLLETINKYKKVANNETQKFCFCTQWMSSQKEKFKIPFIVTSKEYLEINLTKGAKDTETIRHCGKK